MDRPLEKWGDSSIDERPTSSNTTDAGQPSAMTDQRVAKDGILSPIAGILSATDCQNSDTVDPRIEIGHRRNKPEATLARFGRQNTASQAQASTPPSERSALETAAYSRRSFTGFPPSNLVGLSLSGTNTYPQVEDDTTPAVWL